MNDPAIEIIQDTTIEMVDVFQKMVRQNFDEHKVDMMKIMISVLTSVNATILHSFTDTIMNGNGIGITSKDYVQEYTDIFGDMMMKIGGNTFRTCIAKMETIENKEVH